MTLRLWLIPAALTFAIYWRGLDAWFQQDDFAWLSLIADVRDGGSVWTALFQPSQHGTWRPLSERAYFLFFPWLFGYESWPMRVLAFATQLGSLWLAGAIVHRLTASGVAAVAAPVLWIANSKMVIAMISNGAYVHLLGGFCLLAATWALVSGRRRTMWAAYLTGFLAIESNVVFPAIATTYALFIDRTQWRRVAWLWPPAILYTALHVWLAPKQAAGSYAMHLDLSILQTLGRYWWWAFQPDNFAAFNRLPAGIPPLFAGAGTVALLTYAICSARSKQFVPVLFLAWFAILLGPVLPLRGHVTDYYLTVPLAALAMLAASALRNGRLAAAVCAAYLAIMVPVSYGATRWWSDRSHVAERFVKRVFALHDLHPGQDLVLDGVTSEEFWAAAAHYPFLERGRTYVHLTPETIAGIEPHPESGVRLEEFAAANAKPDAVTIRVR